MQTYQFQKSQPQDVIYSISIISGNHSSIIVTRALVHVLFNMAMIDEQLSNRGAKQEPGFSLAGRLKTKYLL